MVPVTGILRPLGSKDIDWDEIKDRVVERVETVDWKSVYFDYKKTTLRCSRINSLVFAFLF